MTPAANQVKVRKCLLDFSANSEEQRPSSWASNWVGKVSSQKRDGRCLCVRFELSHLGLCVWVNWETSSKPAPLRLSCYPNTSKQSGPLAGARRGGGARAQQPRSSAGRSPRGEAGPLLKPWTPGQGQPGAGHGLGRSSARSLPEGDGPAGLRAPTFPAVRGEKLAQAPGSGRALSTHPEHARSLHIPIPRTAEDQVPLSLSLPQIMSSVPGTARRKRSSPSLDFMTFPSCASCCPDLF